MKINLRLILITFSVTFFVSVTAIIIFYSLTNKILSNQHTKTVLNSANHFAITLENSFKQTEVDYNKISPKLKNSFNSLNLDSLSIDFIFTLIDDSLINKNEFVYKKEFKIDEQNFTFHKFVELNPNIILKFVQNPRQGQTYYYGRIIDTTFLNDMSKIIRADIVLLQNNNLISSNQYENKFYNYSLKNAVNHLKDKNNFDIYADNLSNYDLIASFYSPRSHSTPFDDLKFIVFSFSRESAEYRDTMQLIIIILTSASLALSLIFVLFFTTKFRKQLSSISQVVEQTRSDNLSGRVNIISNDELGNLGLVLNQMLDEVQRREKKEHDYVQFVTLINENATLTQISEAVLKRIIESLNLTVGIFYVFDGEQIKQTAYYGLNKDSISNQTVETLYSQVFSKKQPVEFVFNSDPPVIKTALTSIELRYIIIFPIIFNKEIIGIIELASIEKPEVDIIRYLDSYIEQLSVGLSNAIAYEKLENLVTELKLLNEQYQIQNAKVKEQNEQLVFLHRELKGNTIELEEQRAKAVESAKVKSQFLAGMSHELRTPLNAILGLSELILKSESLSKNNSERIKVVINNGKKLLNIINNILTFSKIESDNLEYTKETFPLSEFVTEVCDSFESIAINKNLNFNVEFENGIDCLIDTDKFKLEQIISNLLSNAVKFTESGEIKVNISVIENNVLKFVVKDTGIGISAKDTSLVFEEFRQTSEGSNRRYGGTGLGLTIAKRMTEFLGGNISLTGEVGLGTIVTVTLPNLITQILTDSKPVYGSSAINNTKTEILNLQNDIIMFSNNPENIDLFNSYLGSNKFIVSIFDKASDFLRNFDSLNPTAFIVDFLLNAKPFELIAEIKNNEKYKSVPIIVYYFPVGEKSGFIFNPHNFIFAPLTYENFLENIKQVNLFYNINCYNILTIGNSTFSVSTEGYKINNIKLHEATIEYILSENPDLIFVDFGTDSAVSSELLFNLSTNKTARSIPTVLIIPEDMNAEKLHSFNMSLFNCLGKNNIPKMDSLRILREKLQIITPTNFVNEKQEEIILNSFNSFNDSPVYEKKNMVMIVDDDKDTLFTVGQIVESLGYDILFARDGLECLLMLETKKPDLILLDIMMPRMDGFETIKRINENSKFSVIPVIALTAHAMLEEREIIIKNGFADLITKPIDILYLAERVNKILNKESKI